MKGFVTHPAGPLRHHPLMSGPHPLLNVAEWCYDAYGPYTLRTRKRDGKRDAGPGEAGFRVIRGGGSQNTAVESRSTCRNSAPPEYRHADLGLRPARRLASPKKQ